jgi:tetratricopeptide (TPR) repeat protein
MRARNYIYTLVALLALMMLTPQVCSAQRERTLERSTLPDSLSRSYRHTEAVKRLTIDGDTTRAKELWFGIIAEDSTYAPALYNISKLEEGTLESLEYARRAFVADTTNKWYVQNYASNLISTQKYSQAIPIYRRLMRLAPRDIDAYHALAVLYGYSGMPYTAINILDSAEIRTGYNPYLGEMKLQLLLDTHQYDRAMETGKRGVLEQPYDARARINLAEAYERGGRDSLARITLEEALQIDSTNIEALTALSLYHERKGDNHRMLDYEERIILKSDIPLDYKLKRIELLTADRAFYGKNYIKLGSIIQRLAIAHPNNRKVADCYAEHMIALGELESAYEYLARHLHDEGTTPQHYIDLLQLASYLGHDEMVITWLGEALELYPTSLDIISYMGFYLLSHDLHKDAIRTFKEGFKVCDNDINRSEMCGYIGDIYHEMGKDRKAFKYYRKALKYDSNNAMVLNNYAYFLSLKDKRLDAALAMSTRATELEPSNATYVDTHAWVLHRLGRNEEAKSVMSQALSLSAQRDASLLAHYGDILWALGETFMADTYWKKAVSQGYDMEAMEEHIAELKSKSEAKKSRKR